ncbi:hypothetical protein SGLAM104S_00550 [Streptomyces glaucescens]
MAEQDGGGAVAFGGGVQRGVPGVPGSGFGAALAAYRDGGGLDRVEAEFAQAQADLRGAQVGAGLEAVVDGDAARADAELGRLEGEGGGEGHAVGAAGAGDEDERRGRGRLAARPGWGAWGKRGLGLLGEAVVGEDVVEDAADRQAYRRDRRMGTHVRFPS